MQSSQSRRRFLATLSSAGVAGLMGTGTPLAQEGPPKRLPSDWRALLAFAERRNT